MSVINEVCGNEATVQKNMGGKKQCLEAPVKTFYLAKDEFAFTDLADAKTEASWDTAIAAKNIVPLPNIEGLELANTDAVIKNGRYQDYELKEGVPGVAYRLDLSICSYDALKSYKNSGYTRVFEVTNAEEFTCDVLADGSVKGRKYTSMIIGLRNQATDDDVPFVNVNLKFQEDVYDILKAPFEASDKEGIFDVILEVQGTPNATTLIVKATLGCTGSLVTTLETADWLFTEAGGDEETISGASYDADTGFYTLTATAFVTGTIATDGVVTKANINYEAAPVAVTIS